MIDLYINMKKRLKSFTTGKFSLDDDTPLAKDENATQIEEEKRRLASLGNLVVLDYIRSSLDILLNLKIENALLDNAAQQ